MTEEPPIVFVVDDDAASRDSIAAVVESMGVPVRAFPSAEQFIKDYAGHRRGCLVTDLRMLGMSGLDLLERLRAGANPLPVIVITAFADVALAVRAMRQGAFMLLEKPCRSHDLWEAVHGALEANAAVRREVREQEASAQLLAALSPEEQLIVKLILKGQPNKAIASELGVSTRTIESRRRTIFDKLQIGSMVDLVRLVIECDSDLLPEPK